MNTIGHSLLVACLMLAFAGIVSAHDDDPRPINVPEPSSLVMLASGVAGLGVLRGIRRKA